MIQLMTTLLSCLLLIFVILGDNNSIHAKSTKPSRREFQCSGRYLNHPYCRYTKGDCQSRIVINAPHGGELEPPDVPPRLGGCMMNGKCDWSYVPLFLFLYLRWSVK